MTSYQKLKAKIERLERHIRILVLEEENPYATATLTKLYRIRFMTEDVILFGSREKNSNINEEEK